MSPATYFHRVHATTASRFWINNPTPAEVVAARAHGTVNCTSNPTYCARMLKVDTAAAHAAIDAALKTSSDDAMVADVVQQQLLARLMDQFEDLYDPKTKATGLVSLQGDPRKDTDAEHIIGEIKRYRSLRPNFLTKIPATAAGLKAIAYALEQGLPVIATEVFTLSQAIAVADVHRDVFRRTGQRPPLFLTHISGIFDDYLAAEAKRRNLTIDPDLIRQAGLIVAREQYRLLESRGYEGITMLGGGARGTYHFTEVVGGTMHVTLNPNTVEDLVKMDLPVVDRLHAPTSASTVATLCAAFPEFQIALIPGAQKPEDFEHYGPVKHFLDAFIAGWNTLLAAVAERRAAAAAAGKA